MNIEEKRVADLIPYERNAKEHPQKQIEKIAESIKQYGFRIPILVDKNNVIISGHGRYAAAKQLNLDTVPCVCVCDLSDEQVKAFRLADNKVAESVWDNKILLEELDGLDDLFTGFDFSDYWYKDMLDNPLEENEAGIEYKIVIKSGDVEKVRKLKKAWDEICGL